MAELGELLGRALDAGAEAIQVQEETVDVRSLVGPEHREQRSELAEALAGSKDRSSRAYLSQRRNVERWSKGRTPKPITIRRIVDAQRAQRARRRRIRGGAGVRLRIRWYGERKPENVPPGRWLELPADTMTSVLDRFDAGDQEGAGQELWRAFLGAYGVPNPRDWIRDVQVDGLELDA